MLEFLLSRGGGHAKDPINGEDSPGLLECYGVRGDSWRLGFIESGLLEVKSAGH